MHERTGVAGVNGGDGGHRFVRQRRQAGGGDVLLHLAGAFCARNGAGDIREHQNPPQRHLPERRPRRRERAQGFHRLQARLEIQPGKGLPHIKSLAMPVEGAVVIRRECAGPRQLAGQHAGGKRQPRQNPHPPPPGFAKKQLARTLAENVEDNLHGLHARKFNRLERVLHLFHAHAVVADFAGFGEIIQNVEHLRHVENLLGRAMQLQQVNTIRGQILEAAIEPGRQVFPAVAARFLHLEAASGLGGDVERLAAFLAEPGEQLFAVAVAINIRRVEKIDPQVQAAMQRRQGILVIDRSPGAADGPGPKADGRDLPSRPSQFAIFHNELNEWLN